MSERKYNNTYPPPDAETQLKDAGLIAATAAATVGGNAKVLNFGADIFRSGGAGADGQAPYVRGDIVVDVIALVKDTGDEEFRIAVQLADTEAFDNVVVNRIELPLGQQLVTTGSPADQDTAPERYIIPVDNELGGRTFQFMRLVTYVAGTIGGGDGINYTAYLHKAPRLGS